MCFNCYAVVYNSITCKAPKSNIVDKKWLGCLAYIYVLWHPIAFENWLGTRLYRNSLFPPLMFLFLALMLIWLNFGTPLVPQQNPQRMKPRLMSLKMVGGHALLGLLWGVPTCLIFLLKEDTVWCFPLVGASLGIKIALIAKEHVPVTRKILCMLLSLCPILPVGGGIWAAKEINQQYFGVSLLNTRTEGEVAEFVAKVYKVDNEDQSVDIWSPESSIDAVFKVSKTLSSNPKLLWSVKHIGFVGSDIKQNPLRGDFLTWQIRVAYDNTFGWHDEPSVQHFFKQANEEIDKAFADGRLKKTEKHSPSALLVPRDSEQMLDLVGPSSYSWWDSVVMLDYHATKNTNNPGHDGRNVRGLNRMHVDPADPNPVRFPWFSFETAQRVSSSVRLIYSFINVILLIACGIGTMLLIANLIRKKGCGMVVYLGALGLLAYAWVYCFSVNWFAEFLNNPYVTFFYSACVSIPLVSIGLLLGISVFAMQLRVLFAKH